MASSLELNKVIAGILTAGILASASGIIAGMLYAPHEPEEHAFSVAPEESTSETAEAPAAVPFDTLLAEADPAAGEGLTRQCAACHTFDEGGANKVGPHLWDVVGRDVASVEGFKYTDAIQAVEGDWDFDKLNHFLASPRDYVPGTAMSFAGIKDDKKRADLIAYLDTLSENPVPLPSPAPAEAAAAEPAAAEGEPAAEASADQPVEQADATEAAPAAETAATEAPAAEAPAETAEAAPEAPAEAATPTTTAEATTAEPATAEPATAEPATAEPATAEPATAEATTAEPATAEATTAEAAAAEPAPAGDAAAAPAGGGASGLLAAVAAADPADGKKLFRQCAACHSPDEGGGNRVGPALWGVYGRDVGTAEGFNYSEALQEIPGSWDAEKLDHYLANPKEFAPGNKMVFAGLRKEEDRVKVIAFLHSLSDSPVPLDGQ